MIVRLFMWLFGKRVLLVCYETGWSWEMFEIEQKRKGAGRGTLRAYFIYSVFERRLSTRQSLEYLKNTDANWIREPLRKVYLRSSWEVEEVISADVNAGYELGYIYFSNPYISRYGTNLNLCGPKSTLYYIANEKNNFRRNSRLH